MSTKLQMKDIKFCSACAKPLAGEYYTVRNKLYNKEKWHYHNTVAECANAPAIKKDWRRIERTGTAEGDIGFGTHISGSDGYQGNTDDDMSMRFESVES